MKKIFRLIILLLIISVLFFTAYRYFLSGKSSYQSIYLVPSDAVIIIESDAIFNAWDKIVHSDAWKTVSQIESLAELNNDIRYLDSLMSNKIFLFSLLNKRKVMMSVHEYVPGKYEYLYNINIGRITRLRNPEKILSSIMGKEYPVTKRIYNGKTIYEMFDKSSGEMYIFSFIHDKLVFSSSYRLVESSVKEMDKMALGRDENFINVQKRVSGKGLFNIYVNFKYLPPYLKYLTGQIPENMQNIHNELTYSGFSFSLNAAGLITLEGYTSVNEKQYSIYSSILSSGSGGMKSMEVIPENMASLVKISINNPSAYFNNSLKQLQPREYEAQMENVRKLEKKLKIRAEEHILSWIDDEIVLLQTRPSNLGSKNEFAAIIKAKSKRSAEKNLEFITRQIQRNTPVKLKSIQYEGYFINYISFPGLIRFLFGRMLNKLEKPYYTIINDYVIFSNHPQTLKNIIDDYVSGRTLKNSPAFGDFIKEFGRRSNAFSYIDVPVFYDNLQNFTNYDAWNKLVKNRQYISHFPQTGIQIENKDNLLHLTVKALYSDTAGRYMKYRYDGEAFLQLFASENNEVRTISEDHYWFDPKIIIHNLDDKRLKVAYNDGSLHYDVELRNGVKHGSFKEYFPNGRVKVNGKFRNDVPDGTWKLYDETGTLILKKEFSEGLEVR